MGVVSIAGSALSPSTVLALEQRMLTRPGAAMVARKALGTLIKPKPYKAIPYVGWAIAIGTALYAGYEVYDSKIVDFAKMEAGTYTADDMIVFRGAYNEMRKVFFDTEQGLDADKNKRNFIIIPGDYMPFIAYVDKEGAEVHGYGYDFQWDPASKIARRRAAMSGRGRANSVSFSDGSVVRGSWEEYPFASTKAVKPGAHVDVVPLRENWLQGGFIRAAAMTQHFKPGQSLRVYIMGKRR